MALFLILAAIILLFLFLYQRRRYTQQQELADLQVQFQEQSLRAQLEIQEQTFQAISQEIHDNVGQVLSLARVQINIMNESDHMDRAMLQQVKDHIGKAMSDLRDLAKSMNGERIRIYPLHETLLQECESINRSGVICAVVAVEGELREVDPHKKLLLFRIIQEGLQNCIKHAEAAHISIHFCYRSDAIEISITDDGKGFNIASTVSDGSGLANIRRRAALTGGSCVIESGPGAGTAIRLAVPLTV